MAKTPSLFLCSCEASQRIDAKAIAKALDLESVPTVYEQLCRSQIEALNGAAHSGAQAIICCTQEAPILAEAWEDAGGGDVPPVFVNIREQAGWSEDGANAAAKMAALIAESQVHVAPTTLVALTSEGHALILGRDDTALDAARRLAPHLDVRVLLEESTEVLPPATGAVPVFAGRVASASGHLGAFSLVVESLNVLEPSSRGEARFAPVRGPAQPLQADLIIDLRGRAALFPAPAKRDGYLRPDVGNPAAVERALFDALDLVGEFEKPRYVRHSAPACAHARNGIVACTACIDSCPTSAITAAGDHVAIDPYVCAGCGECAAVCPTGANSYQYPTLKGVMDRARALLGTFAKAGGKAPVIVLADATYGAEAIAMMARYGRGLPARVLPLTLNAVSGVGLDLLLGLMAYGASRVLVLANPAQGDEFAPLRDQVLYANAVLAGLGYGDGRVAVVEDADPDAVEQRLWTLPQDKPAQGVYFAAEGGKREILSLALGHLHTQAPQPQDRVALPQGAPFGAVIIDAEACTLCLACTSACPAAALKSNPDRPELRFRESACVQCGLCRKTCPEKIITLEAGIDFTGASRNFTTLKAEDPFECIRCGKPFGTKASIDRMIEKLKGHAMFSAPGAMDRLKMCEDCRVADMAEAQADPYAQGTRPVPRTTDDYLREREAERMEDPAKKPN